MLNENINNTEKIFAIYILILNAFEFDNTLSLN